ncbi:MAG: tetratricopeptide repeat protein [Deltaproteobacteria bacterium]|nr:tetratricopeptide repeat protein [Deltaproteobacteria bacterium]
MSKVSCKWVIDTLSLAPKTVILKHERDVIKEHLEYCKECRAKKETIDLVDNVSLFIEPSPLSKFKERQIISAALEGVLPKNSYAYNDKGDDRYNGLLFVKSAAALFIVAGLVAVFLFINKSDKNNKNESAKITAKVTDDTSSLSSNKNLAKKESRTSSDSLLSEKIVFNDDTTIRTANNDLITGLPGSVIQLKGVDLDKTDIKLLKGTITVEAAHKTLNHHLFVDTEKLLVEVKGTIFKVAANEELPHFVQVDRGVVLVTNKETRKSYLVEKNREYRSDLSEVTLYNADELIADGSKNSHEIKNSETGKSGAEENSDVTMANPTLLAGRAISEKNLDEAAIQINIAAKNNDSENVPLLLSRLARAYRQQQKYSDAKKTYLRLITEYKDTVAGQNALVALAQFELSILNESNSAKQRFSEYLKLYPEGYLAEEAFLGNIQSGAELGRYSEVIKSADRFIGKYPNSPFMPQVLIYRVESIIKTDSCDGARNDLLKIITSWPRSVSAKKAQHYLEECSR